MQASEIVMVKTELVTCPSPLKKEFSFWQMKQPPTPLLSSGTWGSPRFLPLPPCCIQSITECGSSLELHPKPSSSLHCQCPCPMLGHYHLPSSWFLCFHLLTWWPVIFLKLESGTSAPSLTPFNGFPLHPEQNPNSSLYPASACLY